MRASGGWYSLPSSMWTGKTAGHLFCFMKPLATASNENIGPWRIGGSDYSWVPYSGNNVYDGALTSTRYNVVPAATLYGKWFIYEVSCGGGTHRVRRNGVQLMSNARAFAAPSSSMILTSSISRDQVVMGAFLALRRGPERCECSERPRLPDRSLRHTHCRLGLDPPLTGKEPASCDACWRHSVLPSY